MEKEKCKMGNIANTGHNYQRTEELPQFRTTTTTNNFLGSVSSKSQQEKVSYTNFSQKEINAQKEITKHYASILGESPDEEGERRLKNLSAYGDKKALKALKDKEPDRLQATEQQIKYLKALADGGNDGAKSAIYELKNTPFFDKKLRLKGEYNTPQAHEFSDKIFDQVFHGNPSRTLNGTRNTENNNGVFASSKEAHRHEDDGGGRQQTFPSYEEASRKVNAYLISHQKDVRKKLGELEANGRRLEAEHMPLDNDLTAVTLLGSSNKKERALGLEYFASTLNDNGRSDSQPNIWQKEAAEYHLKEFKKSGRITNEEADKAHAALNQYREREEGTQNTTNARQQGPGFAPFDESTREIRKLWEKLPEKRQQEFRDKLRIKDNNVSPSDVDIAKILLESSTSEDRAFGIEYLASTLYDDGKSTEKAGKTEKALAEEALRSFNRNGMGTEEEAAKVRDIVRNYHQAQDGNEFVNADYKHNHYEDASTSPPDIYEAYNQMDNYLKNLPPEDKKRLLSVVGNIKAADNPLLEAVLRSMAIVQSNRTTEHEKDLAAQFLHSYIQPDYRDEYSYTPFYPAMPDPNYGYNTSNNNAMEQMQKMMLIMGVMQIFTQIPNLLFMSRMWGGGGCGFGGGGFPMMF